VTLRILRAALALALLPAAAPARQVTVTLLATTDLHGNLVPIDYFTGKPADRGLAKIATLVRAVRREAPNALLIDCGDTIQGTPLETVYQSYVTAGRLPLRLRFRGRPLRHDPMMAAMNRLGYDALVLGNHDFNYGVKNLDRARGDARFPWLSANTLAEPGGVPARPFDPYILRTVDGIRIAIIGLTTPAIPQWEEPAHYQGYRFTDALQAAQSTVAALRRDVHPDLIVAAVHAGLGRPERRRSGSEPAENMVLDIATDVRGIDAIVFGHSHQQLAGDRVGDVLLVQPKNWGGSLARLDFTLDDSSGHWRLVNKTSRLIPVKSETAADPEILSVAEPYHDLAQRFLDTPVTQSPVDMEGRNARFEDTALVDAIQTVQLADTGADVSFTALFYPGVSIHPGPVTVRQIAALYIYENELYTIEGDGKMVKDALENSARFFRTCPNPACSHGPLVSSETAGFNYDMAEGVDYEIDLTRPEGQRIVNLNWHGRPLDPNQKLRIAVNNYRAGGSGGYGMFRNAKVLWKSNTDIRSLIIDYYTARHRLPTRASGNWRIIPPEAVKVLEREETP
jgi:2',3'-cyclic-nucleotide 2'-phosphodiesterase / 3'-nucleotidase